MTYGWSGADPVQFNEVGANLEIGNRYLSADDIIVTGIRVWHGANSSNVASRDARIWNSSGTAIAVKSIDSILSSGWTEYTLNTPLSIASGTTFYASYETVQYYGARTGVTYPVASSDSKVSVIEGRFIGTRESFPTTVQTTVFYGVDIIYTEDLSGNQPPAVTGIQVVQSGLSIVTTATVTDETPATVSLTWDWGDGSTTTTGDGVTSSDHTYTASGLYAVMATATDAGGLTDTYAVAVQITVSATATSSEEWFDDIFDAVVSDAQRSAYFDKVNKHEPKKAPGTGLTAAVWLEAMDPIGLISGLASTSARLIFKLRIYQSMLLEPQDMIDPRMAKAVANLMRRYHDDFDFEGAIRNIDLLGAYGVSLSAITGYLDIDGKMFRIADLTIPCLVNDVWPQVQ